MADRRSFLSGLVSLPLIGGGVMLIGRPTAAAVPVTMPLLINYEAWLAWERFRLCEEVWGDQVARESTTFLRMNTPASRWHFRWPDEPSAPPPSTRAAVILSAAGVPLEGGRHG